jgi:hypothetical protein
MNSTKVPFPLLNRKENDSVPLHVFQVKFGAFVPRAVIFDGVRYFIILVLDYRLKVKEKVCFSLK